VDHELLDQLAFVLTDVNEAIALVAAAADPARCRRGRESGLGAFVDDLRSGFSR
jgi:hypothetical protein